ncbi:recombination mediator RecR [Candidatus Protochlamydia phocaeensis]|uniref:recombination mediator RecR n=1 Tax=Candidatus Protochlamydia phocaeensis TaxID=1414722 RepID=UPI000839AD1D|nr:recombination mediator RecR [Candidatus Protochlamydia phocaeensis]
MHYPDHLLKLIHVLKKLPGVGNKSAERFAFHLLTWPTEQLSELGHIIQATKDKLQHCSICGCLKGEEACVFCDSSRRDAQILCVIASSRDVFAIEETGEYQGLYHVLGGLLSPLEGRGPDRLSLKKLKERIISLNVKEIVMALDSTLEGDATSLFLKQELAAYPVHISRLAFGLPMGSSLDYVDGGTLARALAGRSVF